PTPRRARDRDDRSRRHADDGARTDEALRFSAAAGARWRQRCRHHRRIRYPDGSVRTRGTFSQSGSNSNERANRNPSKNCVGRCTATDIQQRSRGDRDGRRQIPRTDHALRFADLPAPTREVSTMEKDFKFATRAIHAGQEPDPSTGAVMTPIYATSTYAQSSPGVHKGYEYARTQNPTRMAFERCVADLESGRQGFAFASGLAASATLLDALPAGSHVVALDDLYGGTYRLFERVRKTSANLQVTFTDMRERAQLEAAIQPNTRMIWVESPSNPLLKLVDLAMAAAVARDRGVLAVADNTFATPYVQRPLEFGFDVVLHSVTKYLNGHSDMVGGVSAVGA